MDVDDEDEEDDEEDRDFSCFLLLRKASKRGPLRKNYIF